MSDEFKKEHQNQPSSPTRIVLVAGNIAIAMMWLRSQGMRDRDRNVRIATTESGVRGIRDCRVIKLRGWMDIGMSAIHYLEMLEEAGMIELIDGMKAQENGS